MMATFLASAVGAMVGTFLCVFVLAMAAIAGEADERQEKLNRAATEGEKEKDDSCNDETGSS